MSTVPLLVTARLAAPLALGAEGPPMLDALLEWCLSIHHSKAENHRATGYKIDRALPCPPQGEIPIPIRWDRLGGWRVPRCSSAITPVADVETVEHVAKRIAVEEAALLAPAERKVVSTTNSWTKSYRIPLRVLRVPCVRWFAVGDRSEVESVLRRHALALGKKVADGYGTVAAWQVEAVAVDHSWFAPHPSGQLLMRPLPCGPWLPADLVGCRKNFGACAPPYWHPERFCETVTPV